MPTIDIPHDPSERDKRWKPRDYQRGLWAYLENGGKRAIAVWRRRSGKDEIALHWTCVAMHQRPGNYWHMLPEASQARKAVWDAIDPHRNLRRIDIAFPHELRKNTRNSDMWIEMKCGSTWQVVGSDNFNSLIGSPPVGIVLSEWALADPYAWAYLKPILEDNGGWAVFITTPRGPNHAKRMYDAACQDESWHTSILDAHETGMDEVSIARLRNDYITDFGEVVGSSLFEQEYLCSFEAAILGAVYGKEMRDARNDGRITDVPYDASLPVETWWDLGASQISPTTAVWFVQREKGGALRAIDYHEAALVGLDYFVKLLREKPYAYSQHLAPHDAAKGEFGTGKTIAEQARALGLNFQVQRKTSLDGGINATRGVIQRMKFDARKCERGIDALIQYRYEWNEQRGVLSPTPVHDWASHPADALRTGAGTKQRQHRRERPELPRVNVI